MERVWLWLRERFLSLRVFPDLEAIVDACCHAWNAFTDDPHRIRSLCLQPWIKKVIGYARRYQVSIRRSGAARLKASRICFSISISAKKAAPMPTISKPSASDTGPVPNTA